MKNTLAIIGIVAVIAGMFFVLNKPAPTALGESVIRKVDILGTGTSTAGSYNFVATAATTTVTFLPGGATDIIDLDIYPESASSTAHVGIQVLKSNLARCQTSGGNLQDWVDAIATNAVSAHITTIAQATSTVAWAPTTRQAGTHYRLTNFNSNCAKLFIGGQSVNLYIQATLKSLSF